MNLRQKKKKIKKRRRLDKVPKDVDIFRVNALCEYIQKELSRRVWEKFENDLLYGEQNVETQNAVDKE